MNDRWPASVGAAFNGIPSGGKYDESVRQEQQYQTFRRYVQNTVSIKGGDPILAASLREDPTQYDTYVAWTQTSLTLPDVAGFQTVEIWNLMRNAASSEVRSRANDIQNAFEYIVAHPQRYRTAVTFSAHSNWAKFGLATPAARIVADLECDLPEDTVVNTTKVTWGNEDGHVAKDVTVQCVPLLCCSPHDLP